MTVAYPDLSHAQATVETLMVDECVITLDPQREGDDEFDRGTGQYTKPADDDDPVYDGPCLITPVGPRQHDTAGPADERLRTYRALLPVTAPVIEPRSVLTVTASVRDAQLVGLEFTVLDVKASTMLVARELRLEARR